MSRNVAADSIHLYFAAFPLMGFLIKYIKDGEFVGADEPCDSLESAKKAAAEGVKRHGADLAAVMDTADLDGEPKAIVTRDG